MAKLWVAEYQYCAKTKDGTPLPAPREPADVVQVLDFGGGAVTGASFRKTTEFVSIIADADCHYAVGQNPSASASSMRLPTGVERFFGVDGFHGHKLSVVGAA
jgi:hypothetical protein